MLLWISLRFIIFSLSVVLVHGKQAVMLAATVFTKYNMQQSSLTLLSLSIFLTERIARKQICELRWVSIITSSSKSSLQLSLLMDSYKASDILHVLLRVSTNFLQRRELLRQACYIRVHFSSSIDIHIPRNEALPELRLQWQANRRN